MKKLATISLFIFGVIVSVILVAGLVFYQNKKDNQTINTPIKNNQTNNPTPTKQQTNNPTKLPINTITLNMAEIVKHDKPSDCWMLISGKVYNITGYFGSHPGGSSTMTPSCGKDATAAYMTKDPYTTTSSSSRSAHSSRARSLLTNYYIGDLNQIIRK